MFATPNMLRKCSDWRVVKVLGYLSNPQGEVEPNLRSIANKLNISTSRLRQIFRQETGLPFHRYVKDMRLLQAQQLLRETDLSAKQIIARLKIEDYSHFARDYKKRFGEPPSSTRRQARIADIVKSAMKLSFRP